MERVRQRTATRSTRARFFRGFFPFGRVFAGALAGALFGAFLGGGGGGWPLALGASNMSAAKANSGSRQLNRIVAGWRVAAGHARLRVNIILFD